MSEKTTSSTRVIGGWNCARCGKPLAFETHYKKPNGTRLCYRCNKVVKREGKHG